MRIFALISLLTVTVSAHAAGLDYYKEGAICDRKAGFCADQMGVSLALTKMYLGEKAEQKLMDRDQQGGFGILQSDHVHHEWWSDLRHEAKDSAGPTAIDKKVDVKATQDACSANKPLAAMNHTLTGVQQIVLKPAIGSKKPPGRSIPVSSSRRAWKYRQVLSEAWRQVAAIFQISPVELASCVAQAFGLKLGSIAEFQPGDISTLPERLCREMRVVQLWLDEKTACIGVSDPQTIGRAADPRLRFVSWPHRSNWPYCRRTTSTPA